MSLETKDVPNPKCQVSNQTTYLPNLFQNHSQSSNPNLKPTIGIGNPMGGNLTLLFLRLVLDQILRLRFNCLLGVDESQHL